MKSEEENLKVNLSSFGVDPLDITTPGPRAFDALLKSSGLLDVKPTIKPGSSGNDFYTIAPFQVLSWYPRTVLFPNFIDQKRINHIINLAEKKLTKSTVVLRKGETQEGTKHIRTSHGTFLDSGQDPDGVLSWLEDRIAQVTLFPVENGEPFNVLRYDLDQHYEAHYDVFDTESYGPQESQRVATMLVYLSDVEEGGETVLPLEGPDGMRRADGINFKDCSIGLAYKPRMGDALLFYQCKQMV